MEYLLRYRAANGAEMVYRTSSYTKFSHAYHRFSASQAFTLTEAIAGDHGSLPVLNFS